MRKKVLATSFHTGGINAIIPVIKRISEEGDLDIVTIGHQNSERILLDRGVLFNTISDYNLSDVSTSSMERLLCYEKPNLVLTGTSTQDKVNSDVIEQTVTLAAKNMSIPSLAVLDFWANYSIRFNDIYTGERHKFLPTKIAIMDGFALQDMVGEEFSADILEITGNPHFDDLESKARNFPAPQKKAILDRFNFNNHAPFLFYAGGAFLEVKDSYGFWDQDILETIVDTLGDLPPEKQPNLLFSLHPGVLDKSLKREDFPRIAEYLNRVSYPYIKLVLPNKPSLEIDSDKYLVDSDLKSQRLAIVSDVTMTAISTIGIEAVYMGKPCVSLQPNLSREDSLIVSRQGIIPVGYSKRSCRKIISDCSDPENYPSFLDGAAGFRTDGKATERVLNLVYKMIN